MAVKSASCGPTVKLGKKNPKLCAKKDYDGNPYLYSTKDEKYYAKKIWKPFRPSRPAATKGDVRKN